MAGFYNFFKGEPRFIILTTNANSSVREIHHRMPVVLNREQIYTWIPDTEKALQLLYKVPPMLKNQVI